MSRPLLDEDRIHPAIQAAIAHHNADILAQVEAAIAAHTVLVVGMALNPFPRKARKLLDAAGVAHHYLEYGSYFSQWRRRNTLKMWSGWPTFPMVFVDGMLIGGAGELEALMHSGELKAMLTVVAGRIGG